MAENMVDMVALVLVLIGGLNWGLVGIGNFVGTNLNVVNLILGSISVLEAVVYVVVGLATLYVAYSHFMKK